MYDRFVAGGAEPVGAPLKLESIAPFKTEHFLDNREMGIINIGGDGVVTIDGKAYDLNYKEALYVGRGKYEITFTSKDATKPAKFYINSAPAHASYPIKGNSERAKIIKAGSLAGSNDRVINQLIIDGVAGVHTCQLQMGLTRTEDRQRLEYDASPHICAVWRHTCISMFLKTKLSVTSWANRRRHVLFGFIMSRQ